MTMRDNDGRRPVVRNDGFSWGLPAAIVAGILIVGGLFYELWRYADDGEQ